jgi:hypothetical protein
MLARAGRRCARERRTSNRSPPAAGFTPPGLGQRGSVPSYAGSERARRAAHRGHISQRRAVTARGPRPALPLRSASRLAHLSPPGKGHVVRTGRPVRRGWARFPVTRPRCHRRTVPAVTSRCARSLPGRSLISAAGTARRASPTGPRYQRDGASTQSSTDCSLTPPGSIGKQLQTSARQNRSARHRMSPRPAGCRA